LTPVILNGIIAFHFISRRHPLTVKKSDEGIEVISGLNLKIIATTIGIVVLFWIPIHRACGEAVTKKIKLLNKAGSGCSWAD